MLICQFEDLKYNIQKQITNAYWSDTEPLIFTGDSQTYSNKKFYYFVKHNRTQQCGVAPVKHHGLIYTDPVDKANISNRQFESVFSIPESPNLNQHAKQTISILSTPKMKMIDMSVEGVNKLLQGLSPNKASGLDTNYPKILEELYQEISQQYSIYL